MYRLQIAISNYEFVAPNGAYSNCGIEVWESGRNHIVLFREIENNPGMSVTNATEHLAQSICEEYNVPKGETTRFFETYGTDYDEISYKWVRGVAKDPEWSYYGDASAFKQLIKDGNNS